MNIHHYMRAIDRDLTKHAQQLFSLKQEFSVSNSHFQQEKLKKNLQHYSAMIVTLHMEFLGTH